MSILGLGVPLPLLTVFLGLVTGIVIGSIPGLAGPMVMAALPILISIFGYDTSAFLPVLGFLIGIMKGATVGGAVPAILFNTPGTPDALLTTLDGHPMTKRGKAFKGCAWHISPRYRATRCPTSSFSSARRSLPSWSKPISTCQKRRR